MKQSIQDKAPVNLQLSALKKSPLQSKTDRLIAILRDEIRSGRYRLRERLPSERELVARYTVSRVTVRRALAQLTEDGIIECRQGTGVYQRRKPALHDQEDLAPVTVRVGFVFRIHRWDSRIFAAFLDTFKESVRTDIRVTVYFHNVITPAIYKRDGQEVLIVDGGFDDEDVMQAERQGFYVIMYNRVPERGNYICTNNFMGGCLMMDFLARKGHRQIAVYPYVAQSDLPGDEMDERLRGIRKSAGRHGLDLIPVRPITPDIRRLHHAAQELLRRNTRFTAVAALTDRSAVEFANELENNGVQIPQATGIIGYDDQNFAALLTPPLSTIRQPVAEMARFLARVVNELPQGAKPRVRRQFAPLLIERDSVPDISSRGHRKPPSKETKM